MTQKLHQSMKETKTISPLIFSRLETDILLYHAYPNYNDPVNSARDSDRSINRIFLTSQAEHWNMSMSTKYKNSNKFLMHLIASKSFVYHKVIQ